ncbi:hypothetical protein K2X40_01565 [Candidatus Babeliales bacterium]|nr:hypothetical protein [Candidatus Babeliales bacterium]
MKKVLLLVLALIALAKRAESANAALLLDGIGTVDAGLSLVGTAYKYFNPETDQKCRESMITYATQEIRERIEDATTDLTENMDAKFEELKDLLEHKCTRQPDIDNANQKLNDIAQKITDLEALLQDSKENSELAYLAKNDEELKKLVKTSGAIIGTLAALPIITGIVVWHKVMPLYKEALKVKKMFAIDPLDPTDKPGFQTAAAA